MKPKQNAQSENKSSWLHLRHTYAFAAALAGAFHVYTVFRILYRVPVQSFRETFVPDFSVTRFNLALLIHNFFVYDFLCTLLAVTLLVLLIRPASVSLFSCLGSFVLMGPGYMIMNVLRHRDQEIHTLSSSKNQ